MPNGHESLDFRRGKGEICKLSVALRNFWLKIVNQFSYVVGGFVKRYFVFAFALLLTGCASTSYTHPKLVGKNDLTFLPKEDCETIEKNFVTALAWEAKATEENDAKNGLRFLFSLVGPLVYPSLWVANIEPRYAALRAESVDPYNQRLKDLFASKKCKLVGYKVHNLEPTAKEKLKDGISCAKDSDTNFWLCRPNANQVGKN